MSERKVVCASCGGRCGWADDSWYCLSCGDEWNADHDQIMYADPDAVLVTLRLSERFQEWIHGSGIYYVMDKPEDMDYHDWVKPLFDAPRRKDGSRVATFTEAQAWDIHKWADWMVIAASDNAADTAMLRYGREFGNQDALADLNSGRALMRQIERKLGE